MCICVRLVNRFLHFLFVSTIHLPFSLCYGGIVYEYILVNSFCVFLMKVKHLSETCGIYLHTVFTCVVPGWRGGWHKIVGGMFVENVVCVCVF